MKIGTKEWYKYVGIKHNTVFRNKGTMSLGTEPLPQGQNYGLPRPNFGLKEEWPWPLKDQSIASMTNIYYRLTESTEKVKYGLGDGRKGPWGVTRASEPVCPEIYMQPSAKSGLTLWPHLIVKLMIWQNRSCHHMVQRIRRISLVKCCMHSTVGIILCSIHVCGNCICGTVPVGDVLYCTVLCLKAEYVLCYYCT
jgi:hypothetical protein